MDKKTLWLLLIALGLIIGVIVWFFNPQKNILSSPQSNQQTTNTQISPSETLKSYTDPSGFSFNYPDNLSLINKKLADTITYADIQLTTKGVEGSLAIKITDSKIASVEEWVKTTKTSQSPKEVKLGNLKALEITTSDKILLGALDSGVLFNIEASSVGENDFWGKVYKIVITDFSFAPPAAENVASQGVSSSSEDITFEGEEVVE